MNKVYEDLIKKNNKDINVLSRYINALENKDISAVNAKNGVELIHAGHGIRAIITDKSADEDNKIKGIYYDGEYKRWMPAKFDKTDQFRSLNDNSSIKSAHKTISNLKQENFKYEELMYKDSENIKSLLRDKLDMSQHMINQHAKLNQHSKSHSR